MLIVAIGDDGHFDAVLDPFNGQSKVRWIVLARYALATIDRMAKVTLQHLNQTIECDPLGIGLQTLAAGHGREVIEDAGSIKTNNLHADGLLDKI